MTPIHPHVESQSSDTHFTQAMRVEKRQDRDEIACMANGFGSLEARIHMSPGVSPLRVERRPFDVWVCQQLCVTTSYTPSYVTYCVM